MALIGLRVPPETSRLLGGIEVPGQREAEASFHITMFYLGEGLPIEDIAEVLKVTFRVVQDQGPFTVRTSLLTCFPEGEDGVPVICQIESEALHALRSRLRDGLKAEGLFFSDKHPTYRPHVTLAYAEAPVADQRLPTVEWGVHELVLWGGDRGDRRLTVTFPFSLDLTQKVAKRFLHDTRPGRL